MTRVTKVCSKCRQGKPISEFGRRGITADGLMRHCRKCESEKARHYKATKTKGCSVSECHKPVYGHGYCIPHYFRWRRNGDPFAGGTSPSEPKSYLVGTVIPYSGDSCLIWPYARSGAGYGTIKEDGRMQIVSRLVCVEEHGPPPTPEHHAAHSCGNGHLGCVNPTHLSWKTPVENAADAAMHRATKQGRWAEEARS